jgi:hypothetical protein
MNKIIHAVLVLAVASALGCSHRPASSRAADDSTGSRAHVVNPLGDPALARAKHLAEHEASIAAHQSEPVDESWARETSAALEGELVPTLEKVHARLAQMDCRSATCLATVDFGSYANAATHWPALFATVHRGCGIEFTLGDGAEGATTGYEGTFVYTCGHGV